MTVFPRSSFGRTGDIENFTGEGRHLVSPEPVEGPALCLAVVRRLEACATESRDRPFSVIPAGAESRDLVWGGSVSMKTSPVVPLMGWDQDFKSMDLLQISCNP